MSRTKPIALAITLLFTACKSITTPLPSLPPTPSTPNENPQNTRGQWILAPSYTPHDYRSVTRTFIRQTSNPSSHQDTIEQIIRFSITVDPTRTQSTISGRVDTVVLQHRGLNLSSSDGEISLPLTFTGVINPTAIKLELKNAQESQSKCNSQVSGILSDIRVGIVMYPIHLSSGLRWKDSTLTTGCMGTNIPTTVRIASLYEVLGEITYGREQAVLVQRLDSIHISGKGAQESHQVYLNGSGTGSAKIYINPNSGIILATEISQVSDFDVKSSGVIHHFSQEVTQKIQKMN